MVSGLSLWGVQVSGKLHSYFVPEHTGAQGNERAERLADCAVIRDGQPMDHRDIVNNHIEIGRKEDFENREST
jgi:hypothetical protein